MKKSAFLYVVFTALLLFSCAGRSMIAGHTYSLAGKLKKYCIDHNITSPETDLADSLVKVAERSMDKNRYKDAFLQSDLAGVYYKIAITRQSLNASQSELSQLNKALIKEREHLNSLKEVYDEIKALRKQ